MRFCEQLPEASLADTVEEASESSSTRLTGFVVRLTWHVLGDKQIRI